MQIPSDVLAVLTDRRTEITGDRVRIPFTLDDLTYKRLNHILKAFGGKWDGRKKVRAHVFPFPIEDFVRQALMIGEFPSRFDQGWYPTPPAVVDQMLEIASIRTGMTVLEPSAGAGAVAGPAAGRGAIVDCVEIDERRAHLLREQGAARQVLHRDFLTIDPLDYETGFRRVLMNPPFGKALDHLNHAIGFMGPDALLVSVLPEYVTYNSDRPTERFRELVKEADGELIKLPDRAFESSGTHMRTVLCVLATGPDSPLHHHGWHQAQPRQLDLFAA
ncbi:class I SAM-dependent methyltransferase [Streptomyces sp. NPDC006207]